jgi:hypothetical protein
VAELKALADKDDADDLILAGSGDVEQWFRAKPISYSG